MRCLGGHCASSNLRHWRYLFNRATCISLIIWLFVVEKFDRATTADFQPQTRFPRRTLLKLILSKASWTVKEYQLLNSQVEIIWVIGMHPEWSGSGSTHLPNILPKIIKLCLVLIHSFAHLVREDWWQLLLKFVSGKHPVLYLHLSKLWTFCTDHLVVSSQSV